MFFSLAFRWLAIWIFLGVTLGILNKSVFEGSGLPQAALTLVHLICTVIISWGYINVFHSRTNLFPDLYTKEMTPPMRKQMFNYSCLIVLNIVLGNATIRYLSVPLAQVIRSLVPVSTAVIAFILIREVLGSRKLLVLIVVVVGAMSSVYGDIDHWTAFGLFIAVFGVVMASLKGTLQKKFVSAGDFSFHPIDLIYKSSVYSLPVCLVISLLTEYSDLQSALPQLTSSNWISILISGMFAGLLNIANIMATQQTTAVEMAIAGNLRNALLIAISIPIFSTPITTLNAFGIVVTLIGSAVYSYLSIAPAPVKFELVQKPSESSSAHESLIKNTKRADDDVPSDEENPAALVEKKPQQRLRSKDDETARVTLIANDMFGSDDDDDDLEPRRGGK